MCSYCKKHDETEVPDPYYGGPQGFEKVICQYLLTIVLDLIMDICLMQWKSKSIRLKWQQLS